MKNTITNIVIFLLSTNTLAKSFVISKGEKECRFDQKEKVMEMLTKKLEERCKHGSPYHLNKTLKASTLFWI